MNDIHFTSEQSIRLLVLPSKQMQLYLLMLTIADDNGIFDEFTLFKITNTINLKASRVSGNIAALQKRRLIIEKEHRVWALNLSLVVHDDKQANNFEEIELKKVLAEYDKVIQKWHKKSPKYY